MPDLEKITSGVGAISELLAAPEKLKGAKLQVELSKLLIIVSELESKVKDLEEKLKGEDRRTKILNAFTKNEQEGFYNLSEEIFGLKKGNYCSACFEKNTDRTVTIPLIPYGSSGHQCTVCSIKYWHASTKPAAKSSSSNYMQGFVSRW